MPHIGILDDRGFIFYAAHSTIGGLFCYPHFVKMCFKVPMASHKAYHESHLLPVQVENSSASSWTWAWHH
ncbi:hypothetical protein C0J52_06495 [Blattella germanica]|nr:hypothetical protein C0J52_06495 [Blattella germanica]